ncbi:MAG TPA: histidinol dehydrogenase [Bacillales bacterium]|nr:histidinol dehydrogenase [Bacillales bacterium]
MKIVKVSEDGGMQLRRSVESGSEKQREVVAEILNEVKERGDAALRELTAKLDGAEPEAMKVTEAEVEAAYGEVDDRLVEIMREAAESIRDFHSRQARESWMTAKEDGTLLGQKVTPLEAVGVYVPGGTAAYPSSLMMGVIPAQVAGVERIVVTTPPFADGTLAPGVLVAANEIGVKEIYKVGGAQAVGALAYGTETIAPVDKIVGPGNVYVALAKREVFGYVDIDSIAGPSEIAVLADDSADPGFIAADLLSQAEHDVRAAAVLVTPSENLAEKVAAEVERQLQDLPRREIAEQSLRDHGRIYVVRDLDEGMSCINEFAPEHLEVVVEEPLEWLGKIRHAGAIFLGPNSSEPVGDYFAGPNHVLPTSGTARFSSPLNVDDFVKKSSVIAYSKEAVQANGDKIAALARLEGLEAHARAVERRLEGKR